jgi:curved DNA-binding protein CbpA
VAGSYYEVLGVGATASAADIRAAFRRRAREVHPDRQGEDSPGGVAGGHHAESAMRELNEAWRVLGDPVRRRDYDRRLLEAPGGPRPRPAPGVDPDDVPYGHAQGEPGDLGASIARSLPWAAAMVVLAAIFVFTAFAASESDDGVSASGLVGECVRLERGGVVTEVPCSEANDGRVDLVTARASLCPEGSSSVRLASAASWLCLRPVGSAGTP